MQNLMIMFTFSIFDQEYPFWAIGSKRGKSVLKKRQIERYVKD